MSDWRDIASAPKDRDILAGSNRCAGGFSQVVWWDDEFGHWAMNDSDELYAPDFFTHWMPLPTPPEQEK